MTEGELGTMHCECAVHMIHGQAASLNVIYVDFAQENEPQERRQQKLDYYVSAHGLAASVPTLSTFT